MKKSELNNQNQIRVCEFYSGIGGFHYALKKSKLHFEIVGAFDINTTANKVYQHNFKNVKLFYRLIEAYNPKDLDQLNADLWTLSPPCQPYTAQLSSKQFGLDDRRSKSLVHIFTCLQQMHHLPKYLILENVPGFGHCSTTRMFITSTLKKLKYFFLEFNLSPLQFGVPNARLRYFLIARLNSPFNRPIEVDENQVGLPPILYNIPNVCDVDPELILPISHYLDEGVYTEKWRDDVIWKRMNLFDIVTPQSQRSCCFTKNYTSYYEGTGSILQLNTDVSIQDIWPVFEKQQEQALIQLSTPPYTVCIPNPFTDLNLRFFNPREIANLMHFPPQFTFPSEISEKQQYRCLGNSINVLVVSHLLDYLFDVSC